VPERSDTIRVHDVDHPIAGADIGRHHACGADEHGFPFYTDAYVRAVCRFRGIELDHVGGLHLARNHVVGQDLDQLVLVLRQQKVFDSTCG